jgi:leucyl aminopeptidase
MELTATTQAAVETHADTVAVGLFDGKGVPHDLPDGALQALVERGEARTTFKHLAVTHGSGKRWILVGLGSRDGFDSERARVAAATVHARARELGTEVLCWELPHRLDDLQAAGFVEGTVLAAYAYGTEDEAPALRELVVSDHADRGEAVRRAGTLARAQNRARRWVDTPSNELIPATFADRARELHDRVEVEVEGREDLLARGMGAFAAVAQGADREPALITARYDGGGSGPLLGLVGKAVTHDTGGYSIKPAAGMERMKYDMGGGAAVLGALSAIAELGLPVRVVAVVGAVENVISARAMKPGDVVRAMDGTTIEVTNTDAEGRLVLCDCILRARELGAERLLDIATLTGGVVTALGGVHAGVFADDEAWASQVLGASTRSGERLWRLPLHPDYAEQLKGRVSRLVNSPDHKKAHPIMGAEFLHHFTGEVPWAHVDIAGTGWDSGKPWGAKGGTGFGVRLLTALGESLG